MIPISTPVYTVAGMRGTWQANVTDDHGVDWVCEAEEGWSTSPPSKPVLEERATGDGAWTGPGWYGPRVIVLRGRAIAPTRVGMLLAKDRLKAAVGPRASSTLIVAEAHLARTAMVRLSEQVDIADEGAYAFGWALQLVAADPRRYAEAPVTVSTELQATDVTGRAYPRTYPRTYGVAVDTPTGAVQIMQDGDYDQTPAVITFFGPIESPAVEHVQTGQALRFTLSLSYLDRLVVDLGAQTALLNGTASRVNTITSGSAWFQLVPGLNELRFRGVVGAAPGGITPPPVPQMSVTAASAWT